MMRTKLHQISLRHCGTDGNDTSRLILSSQRNSMGTVFNQKAILKLYIHPASSFPVHGTLIRVAAIIIHNILHPKPPIKAEDFEIEADIIHDGGTGQCKGHATVLQLV